MLGDFRETLVNGFIGTMYPGGKEKLGQVFDDAMATVKKQAGDGAKEAVTPIVTYAVIAGAAGALLGLCGMIFGIVASRKAAKSLKPAADLKGHERKKPRSRAK